MNATTADARIWNTLSAMLDPEFGVSIVELGLVYSVSSEDGIVDVAMTLTTPSCPASGYLVEGAQAALAALPGVREARVHLVWEPPWTPEMLTASAREALGWRAQR